MGFICAAPEFHSRQRRRGNRAGNGTAFTSRCGEISYTARLNGKVITEKGAAEKAAPGSIGLRHDGAPIQFANIYVRELK